MSTEINQEVDTETTSGEQEGTEETNELSQLQEELSKRDETIGSLKRELKDAKKATKQEKTVSSKKTQNIEEEFGLLQKTFLRSAGITDGEEIELAQKIQERTGMGWDELVEDDYFQSRLEKHRDSKANLEATSGVKGGSGSGNAKESVEYWIKKGVPPSREEVPSRKTRAQIARAFLDAQKHSKTFYNE